MELRFPVSLGKWIVLANRMLGPRWSWWVGAEGQPCPWRLGLSSLSIHSPHPRQKPLFLLLAWPCSFWVCDSWFQPGFPSRGPVDLRSWVHPGWAMGPSCVPHVQESPRTSPPAENHWLKQTHKSHFLRWMLRSTFPSVFLSHFHYFSLSCRPLSRVLKECCWILYTTKL